MVCLFVVFLTKRALPRQAEEELKAKLIGLNLENMFGDTTETHIPIETFLEIINSHHETFTVEEVQFLFQILKSPGSNYIDKMRLLLCMQQTRVGWILKTLSTSENCYSDYIRGYAKIAQFLRKSVHKILHTFWIYANVITL